MNYSSVYGDTRQIAEEQNCPAQDRTFGPINSRSLLLQSISFALKPKQFWLLLKHGFEVTIIVQSKILWIDFESQDSGTAHNNGNDVYCSCKLHAVSVETGFE